MVAVSSMKISRCACSRMDDDRTAKAVRKAADINGFQAERPIIEVRSKCAVCATS